MCFNGFYRLQLYMRKIFVTIIALLFAFSLQALSWTRIYEVSSGSEPYLGLFAGQQVKVTRMNYTSMGDSYFIIELPSFPDSVKYEFYQYNGRNTMRNLSGNGDYKCHNIDIIFYIQTNSQKDPGWIRINDCQLRLIR